MVRVRKGRREEKREKVGRGEGRWVRVRGEESSGMFGKGKG